MARIKNASFEGSSQFDVDVDAPTFNRLVENAIGDTAKVYDQVTGKNSEADTIIHDGAGRGALLGIPYINQFIDATIFYDGTGSGKDAIGSSTLLYACPLYIPLGETEVVVDILADSNFGTYGLDPTAYLRDASDFGVTVGDEDFNPFEAQPFDENAPLGNDVVLWRARIRGVTNGLAIFCVQVETAEIYDDDVKFRFHSIAVHAGRQRTRANAIPTRSGGENQAGVTTPSSTQALAHTDFDASLIGSVNDPINGYLTTYLNRNQNALMEYLTGWPAGGNADFTHVDHDTAGVADDVDPARSRFFAHTRSPFAGTPALPDEPEIDFPLYAECFGAIALDGGMVVNEPAIGVAPTIGLLEWYAPWPTDEASQTFRQFPVMVPDFSPDKATALKNSSALRWAVLVGTDKAAVTNWSVKAGPTASLPAAVALAAVPNSSCLTLAQGSALTFVGDQVQTFGMTTERTGTQANVDECMPLGVCFWFQRS